MKPTLEDLVALLQLIPFKKDEGLLNWLLKCKNAGLIPDNEWDRWYELVRLHRYAFRKQ